MKKFFCAVVVIALMFSLLGWNYPSFASATARISTIANRVSSAVSVALGGLVFDLESDNEYSFVYLRLLVNNTYIVLDCSTGQAPYQIIWSSNSHYPAFTSFCSWRSSINTVLNGSDYFSAKFSHDDGSLFGILYRTRDVQLVSWTNANAPSPAELYATITES